MRTLNGQPAPWIKDLGWLHPDIYFGDAIAPVNGVRAAPDTLFAPREVNGMVQSQVFKTKDLRAEGVLKAAKDMADANGNLKGFVDENGQPIPFRDFILDSRVQALLASQGHLQTLAEYMTNAGDNAAHSCFAAGTLVHSKRGLVPIEQLQVGDQVLSKAADGSGELLYKPITKTMLTENVPIFLMEFNHYIDQALSIKERFKLRRTLDDQIVPSPLLVSANHPFWTSNQGWVTAAQLSTQDPMLTHDGKQFVSRWGGGFDGKYKAIVPIMSTDKQDTGYVVNYGDDTGQIPGYFINLATRQEDGISSRYKPVIDKLWINYDDLRQRLLEQTPEDEREHAEFYGFRQGHWRDPDTVAWGAGEGPLTMTVYNIEVEDTHTYFVGEAGIWVHNCGGEETFSNSLSIMHSTLPI